MIGQTNWHMVNTVAPYKKEKKTRKENNFQKFAFGGRVHFLVVQGWKRTGLVNG